jgi:secreted trypsin-like serine protease
MFGSHARNRNRIGVLLIAMMLTAMLGIAPTSAITNGESDGIDHPFVGSLVLDVPEDVGIGQEAGLYQFCSGTLLDGGLFLTASHCLADWEYFEQVRFPGSTFVVTFDPTIASGGTFYAASAHHVHPEYGMPRSNDAHDVGLIELDGTSSLATAQLPTAGMLDKLKADHVLKDTTFTTVGYGTVRDTQKGAFASILDNLDRNKADQGFHSLTKAWLNLPMTPSTGDGGTCYGDSGGPHFIWLDGQETNIVASITVGGDAPCKALDKTYRMDTESARDFLGQFLPLP